MHDRLTALKSDIEAEVSAIARIYLALPGDDGELSDPREGIVTGYYLHNLYNAFESIFRLVAEAFENDVPDPTRWHRLLLERMGREIEGVRPRLLSDGSVQALDELRRFRHLFRHLYQADLKPEGVAVAMTQARRLESTYPSDITLPNRTDPRSAAVYVRVRHAAPSAGTG